MKNIFIHIANQTGFCMGVKNAFTKIINMDIDKKSTVIFGDLVHNRYAVEQIKTTGYTTENELEEIISNSHYKNVIIRAHGIPPQTLKRLKKSNKNIIDLTCPIVKKVQNLANDYSNNNYHILIFGKKNHPEVIGIAGNCNESYTIISDVDQLSAINTEKYKKILLISQTTMNTEIFKKIIYKSKEIFKNHKNFEIKNTLCRFPINSQKYALQLAEDVDIMLVIGDKKSSNTATLYNRLNNITKAFFIETIDEIPNHEIENNTKIGICGGSSTPDIQIQWVIDTLKKQYNNKEQPKIIKS